MAIHTRVKLRILKRPSFKINWSTPWKYCGLVILRKYQIFFFKKEKMIKHVIYLITGLLLLCNFIIYIVYISKINIYLIFLDLFRNQLPSPALYFAQVRVLEQTTDQYNYNCSNVVIGLSLWGYHTLQSTECRFGHY